MTGLLLQDEKEIKEDILMNNTGRKKPDYINFGKYSLGGVGYSMTNMIVMTYLTFFCTDIFGISSMTVAGLMLVTRVIDAITDPIMGVIADMTRSKLGKYRPYLIFDLLCWAC